MSELEIDAFVCWLVYLAARHPGQFWAHQYLHLQCLELSSGSPCVVQRINGQWWRTDAIGNVVVHGEIKV